MILSRSAASWRPEYLAAATGAVSVVFGGFAFYWRLRARATLRWKPTQATITWSQTEERTVRSRAGRQRVLYRPDIRYVYAEGKREYEGSRVYFGDTYWDSSPADTRATVAKYAPGTIVKAFHDPGRPEESVLERGQARGSARPTRIAIGLAVLAMAVYAARGWLG